MSERLFKCLEKGRKSPYAKFRWPYRKWIKAKGELIECNNGIHLCREQDLVYWLDRQIWEAEARGERVDCEGKIIVREARLMKKLHTWNEKTAKLFTCDCAEHVLPIYEKQHPDEKRLRKAIETVRRYAIGKASKKELGAAQVATWVSTYIVAVVASWATTEITERRWQTEKLFSYLYPKGGYNE